MVTGPRRLPRQMLDEQSYGGHSSVHDAETASAMGLAGAPIEGPTHFSQFDPLAYAQFGPSWFERGRLSAHFSTMVVEGEGVTATLSTVSPTHATIAAVKDDGSVVLTGTASLGTETPSTVDERLAALGDPGDLYILDKLRVGQRSSATSVVCVDEFTANGPLYPFSLRQKLDTITEPSDWYLSDQSPWGRPILPFEMVSVLAQKSGADFPVRGPALGLFLDLEVRLERGPIFVGHNYLLDREVLGLSQSRRTESYWVRTTLRDDVSGDVAAVVVLHSGVFKASYADYPADRL